MMGVTSIRIDENKRRVLKVKGLVADMPDNLEIDITDIGIGKALKVGELSFDIFNRYASYISFALFCFNDSF